MTLNEFRMIAHVRQWMAYGGADEDIFVTFGISPLEFYRRVATMLENHPATALMGLVHE